MNLQTFLDAIPSFLWSDGNGAASGLAVTAGSCFCSLSFPGWRWR